MLTRAPKRTRYRLSPVKLSDEMLYFAIYESGHNYDQGLSYGDGYNAMGYYQFDRLAVECQKLDTVAARAENLGAENLQNVTLGTNSLGGEITTTRSSVLVVQLPYSTGWSVTVDGTPAQVLRADTAFLGVALEPGSHTVAFTYKTPGLTAGAALSAAGVVLLAAIWAVPALRKKSKKRRK